MTVPPVSDVLAPLAVSKPLLKVKCVESATELTMKKPLKVTSVLPPKY